MTTAAVSKKAQTHQRIVMAASKELRRAGFHGLGVAEVMREAGLTHGGFYSHFSSRDALIAEAIVYASKESGARITGNVERLRQEGQDRFAAFVDTYLSDEQIDDCKNGCPVSALCSQMPVQIGDVRESARHVVASLQELVARTLPDGSSDNDAWAVASAMVGAMQIARTFGANEQGRAVLGAARISLISQFCRTA